MLSVSIAVYVLLPSFDCIAASTLSFIPEVLVVSAIAFISTLCIGCGITKVSNIAYVLNENKSTPYSTPSPFLPNFFISYSILLNNLCHLFVLS